MRYAFAYLVCLQIMVNNVYIARCQQLIDCGTNLYIQKEQLTLLDEEGHPSLFATIMIATLSTFAQLERDNISFRLQSGRKRYIEKGGKLGRKVFVDPLCATLCSSSANEHPPSMRFPAGVRP